MNIVDLLIIAVIAITIISGMYRGFLSSLLSTAGMLAAWIVAYAVYPTVAAGLTANGSLMNTLFYYTDIASRLGAGVARTAVGSVSASMLQDVLSNIPLPEPFDALLRQNIATQAFSGLDLTTLGDYLNQTLITVVLSVICFLVLFAAFYIVVNIVINLIGHIVHFPILRHFDGIAGGILGFIRGYALIYLLFTLVPVMLTAIPVQGIADYINASRLGQYFLDTNFITALINAAMR